jgi:putative mRNA 3-end processing factor
MLIETTGSGFYCAVGDFHIDPWRPVARAVITHAHSDHAIRGHGHYLCHTDTLPLLQLRLGKISGQAVAYGESVIRHGVRISLHPAGHVIGSAQVRIEYQGETWVISGDYKPENDGVSTAFEPIPCTHFITESTFGLPIYRWKPQQQVYADILSWIAANRAEGRHSILQAYSLGKSQRLIHALGYDTGPIHVHDSILKTQLLLQDMGKPFPETRPLGDARKLPSGSVIITPSLSDPAFAQIPFASANCSGWMQVRSGKRWGSAGPGFTLSDHADWPGLLASINATGASHVQVTHGFQGALSRYLREQGLDAREVKTSYAPDEAEAPEEAGEDD